MSGYLTPMLLLTGVSFANAWYNKGTPDLKILLEGSIATGILALINNIDGMEQVTTMLGWVAFTAVLIAPIQTPSPVANLTKIVGSK
jgi:hypothetical protein